MLILPGRNIAGVQKPRQYGPLSYVRSCVYRNAESLGIDLPLKSYLFPFWEGGGFPRDILNGLVTDDNGGDGQSISQNIWTPEGMSTTGSTYAGWNIPASALDINGWNAITVIALLKWNGSYASTTEYELIRKTTASSTGFALSVYNGTADDIRFISNMTSGTSMWSISYDAYIPGLTDYDWWLYAITYKPGSRKIYAGKVPDIKLVQTNTLFTGNISCDSAYNTRILGGSYINALGFPGIVAYLGIFNTVFSEESIYKLGELPYALLVENPPVVYFDFAAGGGLTGSLNSAWLIETATSRDTSYGVETATSRDTAYQIETAASRDTAYQIETAASRNTSYGIEVAGSINTSWVIDGSGYSGSLNTAWSIETATNRSISWMIEAASSRGTSWLIENVYTRDTAYGIETAAGIDTGWMIETAADLDIAWQLDGAPVVYMGQLNIAWKVGDLGTWGNSYSAAETWSRSSDTQETWSRSSDVDETWNRLN